MLSAAAAAATLRRSWLPGLRNLLVRLFGLLVLACSCASAMAGAQRLVLGSFEDSGNAQRWADRVAVTLAVATEVLPYKNQGSVWHRVASQPLTSDQLARARAQANGLGWQSWVLPVAQLDRDTSATATVRSAITPAANLIVTTPAAPAPASKLASPNLVASEPVYPTPDRMPDLRQRRATGRSAITQEFDLDLAFQSRNYSHEGLAGQARWQPSSSLSFRWHRAWNDGKRSVTLTPFARLDLEDSNRTHVDLRDFYLSAVGDDWELHAGVRRVFWGVTEFHHLVDVINQTDLVENIDGEDKLGQPMVQLSLVRDWGILDAFLLPGFRERTFAGSDGRLRALLPINDKRATYASAARPHRTDAALRYSHQLNGIDFGLYHFSGTNREPLLLPESTVNGALQLRPYYSVIDQTGIDAQWIHGDWAYKLEAITRSGDLDRYGAYVAGVERTLVGVLGTRADLGVVLEYMHDSRGHAAHNTVFERDLALGLRLTPNDHSATNALFGVIYDTQTHEYLVSLEGSRRIGDNWLPQLEMRIFAGSEDEGDPLALLLDEQNKTAALQRDDIVQLEFTRYF